MVSKPLRSEQKELTRQALLDSARRVFAARGFDRAVVADIVREAGVAHGTFYVHFAHKAAVADALLAEFTTALASQLMPLLAQFPTLPLPDVVARAAHLYLTALDADRGFVSWYAERAAAGLGVEALKQGVNPPAVELLSAALAGLLPAPDARSEVLLLGVHAVLAMWQRVGLQFALSNTVSLQSAQDALSRLTLGAIQGLLVNSSAALGASHPLNARRPGHG